MANDDVGLSLGFGSDASIDLSSASVLEVRGQASLSEPYRYRIQLSVDQDGGLDDQDIDALLDASCWFTVGNDDREVDESVHGVLAQVTQLPTVDSQPVDYELILVPRLDRSRHTVRSRVFIDKTVVEIVEEVLQGYDLVATTDYDTSGLYSQGSYPTLEQTFQYRESDLAFISRLMEHWGIFYFFVQEPDRERLVLADSNSAFTQGSYTSLTFTGTFGSSHWGGYVRELSRRHTPRTAKVVVRDYYDQMPFVPEADHAGDEDTGQGHHWLVGEHVEEKDSDAALIAQVRAERELCERVRLEGLVRAPGLAPGHRITPSGCPLPELDVECVVTAMQAVYVPGGAASDEYGQQVTLLPYDTAFRPRRRTPKPRVAGFLTGVVDGASDTDDTAAPIDDQGRYRVRLYYDQASDGYGDDVAKHATSMASCWVRMAQSSAGDGYGMHLPLHVGTEVAIIHVDGDPDRPLIVGAVPNPATTSPVIAANATQSVIKTRGSILLELDDDA